MSTILLSKSHLQAAVIAAEQSIAARQRQLVDTIMKLGQDRLHLEQLRKRVDSINNKTSPAARLHVLDQLNRIV